MVDVVEGEVDVEREVDIERDDYEEYEQFQELASPLLEEGGLSWHVVECPK